MADATSDLNSTIYGSATTVNPNVMLINPANQINSVKLSDDNYLLWNLQVLAGIRGLGLEIFVIENPPVPPRFVEGAAEEINPPFITWCRQDQLLFSFLLASMSEGVQAQMIGCESSTQLWKRVSQLFATCSKACVMQYKLQLQTLKKGQLSMKDYLIKMKSYMDTLATCGHFISEDDQILYILGGVGSEYDSVVVHVTSRVDTLTFPEVGALLLSHEGRLETFAGNGKNSTPSVNAASFSSQKKSDSSQNSNQRGRGHRRSSRGNRRNWYNTSNRPVCQIYGYSGHVAEKCHYRFDKDFIPAPRHPAGYQQNYQGNNRAPPPHHPVAAFTTATSEPVTDDWWYPDSGASHHVTNELGNLTLGSEYSGGGKVHMGNGAGPSHGGNSSQRECPWRSLQISTRKPYLCF